jgi:hypothetical protein
MSAIPLRPSFVSSSLKLLPHRTQGRALWASGARGVALTWRVGGGRTTSLRAPPLLFVSVGSRAGDLAITMSTSARQRLMRDFTRLQVRGARALPFRAACGGSVCELLTCAVRRAARFVARRKNRRPVLVARPQRATSCIGRPSSSAQRTRRGRVVRARPAAPSRGAVRQRTHRGLCVPACATGLRRVVATTARRYLQAHAHLHGGLSKQGSHRAL